jgi:transcription antitermination factor NusG
VFVRIEDSQKWELKKIDGVLNYVYWLGKPAIIRDDEIITIRKFLNEFTDVQVVHDEGLSVNTAVRVKSGIMMNFKGLLLEVLGNKARVRLASLGIQLEAVFDKSNLEPLG